jgi:mannose-1-phosphate guanylyltransferase
MKIVMFAGGSGTRFWPLSREKFPKQFKPLIGEKSTFQVHTENYIKQFGIGNILISTTETLSSTVKQLLPEMPLGNIITEPVRRDLGPAVGLVMLKLAKLGSGDEPTAIVWSDSTIENVDTYFNALKMGDEMLNLDPKQLIFLGEEPKFANENLGWIELGPQVSKTGDLAIHEKKSFVYRPKLDAAKKFFESKTHLWNTGYFMTTPNFVLEEYKKQKPEMYEKLELINQTLDTNKEFETIQKIYPELESISFDNAILEGLEKEKTKVISGNFKWADPGTLYALKQYLQTSHEENVNKGLVYNYKTTDSLVYNEVPNQLIATIGLEGFIIVNTPDALLVCPKDQIPEIKNMLKKFEDTDYKKYL